MQKLIAKIAWLVPFALFGLAINQADVAKDVFETLRNGIPAIAIVTDYERVDRADVTYGYVSLRVSMPDGSTLTREKMSLPHTLMQQLADVKTLDVRVLPTADQNIVVEMVAKTQWKIAAIQAGISFIVALMALAGVVGWNRLLVAQEDESKASGAAPLGDHLANEGVVRAEFMPDQLD